MKFFKKQRWFSPNRFFKKRGQVAILYALLTPIFVLCIGIALDLSWYYLNVSRLQNAADAAAVAGAQTIIDDTKHFPGYKNILLVDKFPADDSNKYMSIDDSVNVTIDNSNNIAKEYVNKNLSEDRDSLNPIIDGWTKKEVETTHGLYEKDNHLYFVVRLREEIQHFFLPGWFDEMGAPVTAVAMLSKTEEVALAQDLLPTSENRKPIQIRTPEYYSEEEVEELSKEIPRESGAGAEGGLPEGTNILAEMYKIEDVSAIRNWEWQDWYSKDSVTYGSSLPTAYASLSGTKVNPKTAYKELTGKDIYSGTWNEYQDKRNKEKRVHYKNGDLYRTEIVEVYAGSQDETKSNGSVGFSESKLDSINLDFHPDLDSKDLTGKQFTEDWDIGYTVPEGKSLDEIQNKNSNRTSSGGYDLRIHSTFNFETPYEVRSTYSDKATNPEDVLYVRIESEPIISLPFVKNQGSEHTVYSTVRQIILNINQSNEDGANSYNMKKNAEGKYIYRPLMFFYSGPEKIDNNSHVRDSQPVILNLNADARVVLFAPNSPVVICGNEKHMQGFVIAKSFVRLTTEDDYIKNGSQYFDKEDPSKECFKIYENHENNNPTMFIDSKGNVQTKPLSSDLNYYTRDPIYEDDLEKPERTDVITYPAYEKVYKMHTAFNIDKNDDARTTSFYDSFQLFNEGNTTTGSLKRNIYTYLDAYTEEDKPNSVDMFFTKIRSSWVD